MSVGGIGGASQLTDRTDRCALANFFAGRGVSGISGWPRRAHVLSVEVEPGFVEPRLECFGGVRDICAGDTVQRHVNRCAERDLVGHLALPAPDAQHLCGKAQPGMGMRICSCAPIR